MMEVLTLLLSASAVTGFVQRQPALVVVVPRTVLYETAAKNASEVSHDNVSDYRSHMGILRSPNGENGAKVRCIALYFCFILMLSLY